MTDDTLAKAAEAVDKLLEDTLCVDCPPPTAPEFCEDCDIRRVRDMASDLARAVLEAAGVAGSEEPESRDAMVHDMVMQSLLEEHRRKEERRRKTALQRAGKEG